MMRCTSTSASWNDRRAPCRPHSAKPTNFERSARHRPRLNQVSITTRRAGEAELPTEPALHRDERPGADIDAVEAVVAEAGALEIKAVEDVAAGDGHREG